MKHLTEAELVDLVEGTAGAPQARHAETCADCRAQAQALGAALASARRDPLPEPSPIFWDHLAARISHAIREAPRPRRTWLDGARRWRLVAAAAAILLAAGLGWHMLDRNAVVPPAPAAEQTRAESPPDAGGEGFVDAWEALETAAEDLDWEDAQSIGVASSAGSAERLVDDLTDAERTELVRLIGEEIKRLGA